jgi:type IV pilus assembly protein PilW
MIAATLGLFLLGGLVQMVSNLKQTYRVQESVSRIQETARFAVEFITKEARLAGFFGCANFNTMTFTNNVDVTKASYSGDSNNIAGFNGSGSLEGFDNIATGDIAGSSLNGLITVGTASANAIAGTDLIYIKSGGALDGGKVVTTGAGTSKTYSGTAQIKIEDATKAGLNQDTLVMVTNCSSADMFGITNNPQSAGGDKDTLAHGVNLNTDSKLAGEYGAGSEILTMYGSILYIGVGASGQNALFRHRYTSTNAWTVEELVDGVDDMQILYGEDTDLSGSSGYGAPNYYVPASSVANMDKVVSLRISLLIPTLEDNVSINNQTYTYNGTTTTAADKRIYRVYTSTVALRNRLQ